MMNIEELENLISEELGIPCVSEKNAVMDGSFTTVPWMTNTFKGNGRVMHITDNIAVNLFYRNKNEVIGAVHKILPILANNNIVAGNPDYDRQETSDFYMVTINVEILEA